MVVIGTDHGGVMGRISRFTLFATFLFMACGNSGSSSGNDPGGNEPGLDGTEDVTVPVVPKAGELIQVEPGGGTICSRGTPYRFFVFGGDPKRVVIDFQGGGACWNAVTCSIADSIFFEDVLPFEQYKEWFDQGKMDGIYDLTRDDNPFQGWTLVHVPYCTGDIHWGDSVHDYGNDLVIHHKGFVNATAALDWIYEHYPDPDDIFVTGCSAGSYGAIMHSAYVANHYPDTTVRVLGDSGAGIITDTFFADSFPAWEATKNLPGWVKRLNEIPVDELSIVDVYAGVAETYPQHRFSHYSTAYDKDQTFYFTAMGGEESEWPGLLDQTMKAIRAEADNFRSYVPPGPMHCVIPYDFFYTRKVGDRLLTDWLTQLVIGKDLPGDVSCEGDGCLDDPVCNACAAAGDETPGYCGFCQGWEGL